MLYARRMARASDDSDYRELGIIPLLSKSVTLVAMLLASVAGLFCNTSLAETSARGSTASTIAHPELAPIGVQLDGYILRPDLLYSVNYTDNIFATESNTEDGFITQLIPSLAANSQWSRHALNFNAFVLRSRNIDFSSEDYTDWELAVDGLIDISQKSDLSLGASTGLEHVERSSPDDTRGTSPTEFDKHSFFTRYAYRTGRTRTSLRLNVVRKEYEDTNAIRFGVPVTLPTSDRDRYEYNLRLRVGYVYVADQQVFASLEKNVRDYDSRQTFSGFDRSSDGYKFLLGSTFDYHGILLGEVAAGYRSQDYNSPSQDLDR